MRDRGHLFAHRSNRDRSWRTEVLEKSFFMSLSAAAVLSVANLFLLHWSLGATLKWFFFLIAIGMAVGVPMRTQRWRQRRSGR